MHLEIENIHHPQIKNMNLSVYDVGYRAAHLHPEIELILVLKWRSGIQHQRQYYVLF